MLTVPQLKAPDPIHEMIAGLPGNGGTGESMYMPGVYKIGHYSFGYEIANLKNEYPEFGNTKNPYGVADSIEQMLHYYADELRDSTRNFCVSCTILKKNNQSPTGGWRWHKWGPYIGNKTPQCEYLYDEGDAFEEVVVYHIYELE